MMIQIFFDLHLDLKKDVFSNTLILRKKINKKE